MGGAGTFAQLVVGDVAVDLDDRVHPLPEIVVGQADDRARPHIRVLVERGLDLRRIHVRAAAHDEVGATVGDVEEAVGIHRAEVAERLPSVARTGLGPDVAVGGLRGGLHPDLADLAHGRSLPSVSRIRIVPSAGLPTEPTCSSQSAPLMTVTPCASVPA